MQNIIWISLNLRWSIHSENIKMIFKVIVKFISWLWFLFLVCILLSNVIYNISKTITKIKVYLLSKEDKNKTELIKTDSESSCVAISDLREKESACWYTENSAWFRWVASSDIIYRLKNEEWIIIVAQLCQLYLENIKRKPYRSRYKYQSADHIDVEQFALYIFFRKFILAKKCICINESVLNHEYNDIVL